MKPKSQAEYAHLICHYANLVCACNNCNSLNGEEILIEPCEVAFRSHLQIDEEGEITALTNEAQDLVNILGLDSQSRTALRKMKLGIVKLYPRYPEDEDVRAMYLDAFGYPDDLPNLGDHSRTENTKPEGVKQSFFRQREAKTLPETYGG